MFDVTALGEILIDFTPADTSSQGNICFERNPGGAPANVLVCISRLGGSTAFIGKVGDDMFGHYLTRVLKDNGVDTSGVRFNYKAGTTLAFVQLDEHGERSFSFYRKPGADTTLEIGEVNYDLIRHSKIFHFGSLSLTDEPSRSATIKAVKYAKECGLTISYDPNLRPLLWKNLEHARQEIIAMLSFADILKISEEELEFITGENDMDKATAALSKDHRIPLILVTRGSKGCYYRHNDITGMKATYANLKAVDTTGAGDAFLGAFLFSMIRRNIVKPQNLNRHVLEQMIDFSNAAASLCVTKRGAIPAMPELDAVEKLCLH